ncbi:MAG: SCO family protein [Actinomycetota bacterium]|nr:SCO family protein [Actinomycetota bacterium]
MTTTSLRHVLAVLAGFVVATTAAACGSSGDAEQPEPDNPAGVVISDVTQDDTFKGAEPATPYEMPDLTLTATNGRDFNLVTDTAYPVTVVFFGYTHCPDVCLLVMSDLTQAMVRLPEEVRDQTQVVFITTDPARDTPGVLRSYLDRYDGDFVGLTGDLDAIATAADGLDVALEGRQTLPSGGYDVGHGAQVIGFRGDSAPVIWTQGTPVVDLVSDITSLATP